MSGHYFEFWIFSFLFCGHEKSKEKAVWPYMIGWFRYFQLPLGIPAEIVYDLSEVCAPLVDTEEVRPLVSAQRVL